METALGSPVAVKIYADTTSSSTTASESAQPETVQSVVDGLLHNIRVSRWEPGRFTYQKQLQEAMRNYGTVDLMEYTDRGFVAVKRMPNTWMTSGAALFDRSYPDSSEKPWLDLALLQLLEQQRFPYICRLHGVFQDTTTTYVVSELASEGDLFTWADSTTVFGAVRETKIVPMARQIFSAVAWMHDLGIVHGDISLENTLLHRRQRGSAGEQLQVKLIDFGMSSLERMRGDGLRGKVSYQAPEMHQRIARYDGFRTDAFALGVLLYTLAAVDYPWQSTCPGVCQLFEFVCLRGFREYLTRRKLHRGRGERLSDVFSQNFVNITKGLLSFSPARRLTLGERCWSEAPTSRPPQSVWDMPWLDEWAA